MSTPPDSDLPLAWVTGAAGLIGRELVRAAEAGAAPGWRVRPLTRALVDLANAHEVNQLFERERPDLIIHCAALSRTGACQSDPALAIRQNVEITQRLVDRLGSGYFIFFSSDLVFDGTQGGYVETDQPNPVNVYGQTKWESEKALQSLPQALVIRTSLNYGHSLTGDRAFNEEMVNAWKAGRPVQAFVDEYRCPIAASETAFWTWKLVRARRCGIVHLAGAERLSRWQIATEIAGHYPALHPTIIPVSLAGHVGTPRAPDVSLNCDRLSAWMGRPLPSFRSWLTEKEPIHLS
jgi:dTDP-4-dehydrorhamnose reductase